MNYSFALTETASFTVTHARHMAAKVATDLKRIQQLYEGGPSDSRIDQYEIEVIAFLKAGYLGTVTYGFKRDGRFIEPTLQYTARELAESWADDDDPGRVRPGADTTGASFSSYLTYSSAWDNLPTTDKEAFKKSLPFPRTGADEPETNGYFRDDKIYSAGGCALNRASLKSF